MAFWAGGTAKNSPFCMPWLPEGLVFMGIMIFFAFFFDFLNFSLIYRQVCGNLIITFASVVNSCAQ